MHDFRIPTCVFGLKVEETSEAEALHFPRRKNIVPVEKKASLLETSAPCQEFNTLKVLLNSLNSCIFWYLPVPVHLFIQPTCPPQQTGLEDKGV